MLVGAMMASGLFALLSVAPTGSRFPERLHARRHAGGRLAEGTAIADAYLSYLSRSEGVHALPESLGGKLPLLCGPVATGFGRGSRKLGIPTANLPCSLFQQQLAELPRGVYVGWAAVRGEVHKCVCNIGISPTFVGQENPETIVEAHLMSEFASDFYAERMALVLLGFVRDERKFAGLDELLATIRSDIATAKAELDLSPLREVAASPRLLAALSQGPDASYELMEPASLWQPAVGDGPAAAAVAAVSDGQADHMADQLPEGPAPRGFEWGPLL